MRTSDSRMVTFRQHPTLPLEIRSYNKRAFYTKTWDEETMHSRGHVTTLDGIPVSQPFTKFLNIGETDEFSREWVEHLIEKHASEVLIYQKYNGHFCQLFEFEGQWINTTKGTFEHPFIEPDRELIRAAGLTDKVLADVNPNWTIIFEALGNHDRHMLHELDVKSLGDDEEAVVVIGVFDRITGREILLDEARHHLQLTCDRHGEPTPEFADALALADVYRASFGVEMPTDVVPVSSILEMLYDLEDTEGVVIHIPSINWRVKLKTNWFIRNRYFRQFNNDRLINLIIKQREEEKIFNKVPEELHDPLAVIWHGLNNNLEVARKDFMELTFELHGIGITDRSDMIERYGSIGTDKDTDVWLTENREYDLMMFRAFLDGEDAFFDAVVKCFIAGEPENVLLKGFMREDLL